MLPLNLQVPARGWLERACISATTREESIPPERNAPRGTNHLPPGGIKQQSLEVVDKIIFGTTVEVALPRGGDSAKIPVACEFGLAVRADSQDVRRRKLEHVLVDGTGSGDAGGAEEPADRGRIDQRRTLRVAAQRAEFGPRARCSTLSRSSIGLGSRRASSCGGSE